MMRATCLSLLSLVFASTSLASATPSTADADLRAELMPLDQRIFASAFLTCDEDALRASMSEDLEFYHDIYGLIAGDLDTFIAGTIPDCIARKKGELPYIERRLVPGSMQVKLLGEWGALQTGRHTFHGQDEHGNDVFLERGTFMHIWERSEQGWHIKRVISYDHQSE